MAQSELTPLTYHQRRACRARKVRAVTVGMRELKRSARHPEPVGPDAEPVEHRRPRVRIECESSPRPCPYVSCKHHLYLDVTPRTGTLKMNFPDLELWEMGETCALDVAAQGGLTLEAVATVMNLTRERVRQLETMAYLRIVRGRKLRPR